MSNHFGANANELYRSWGFTNCAMGNTATGQGDGLDDSDSSDSGTVDTTILRDTLNLPSTSHSSNMQREDTKPEFYVDAAITSTTTTTTTHSLKIHPITDDQQVAICTLLDEYEKISLVYLVASDYHLALQIMTELRRSDYAFRTFLSNEVKCKSMESTKMIIEALCVIQNYEVLKLLGYKRSDLEIDFSPLSYHCAIYINKVRKLCYRVMENLTPDEEKSLQQSIKEDLEDNDDICFFEYQYLEMQFAYLFKMNYVNDLDLSNIVKHFKQLELDHYANMLQMQKLPVNEQQSPLQASDARSQVNTDKSTANMGAGVGGPSLVRQNQLISTPTGVYPMNDHAPGVVLILENIYFYEEDDPELQHLAIKTDTTLEEREGSTHDSKRLSEIFEQFGFKVIHETSVTHRQMLELIMDVAHNKITEEDSSFILIMLSHGLENQIIGCNSIPLNVNEIKKNLNSKALEGKPKILIFQACQGNEVLAIQSSDVRIDAPRPAQISQHPWQKHILEFWSAVPGAVCFRSVSKGSWMVQTLCDVLESSYREQSFYDICTEVNRIISERWIEYEKNKMNVMLTITNSTLDKKFILPSMK